ncbi:hypothetical protein ACPUVO_12620 [Pseudocolwellia sp. HL-MZ19]|uniref:hypothetical protein n=1 Tax=unclassified Pseudocolwellia TaxID=2848178 RepID=UPI003CFB4047
MEKLFKVLLGSSRWLIYIVAFSGFIYKFYFYKSIALASGEPYGLGDLIDLLFVFVVIGIWCTALISLVVLSLINFKQNFLDSIKLFLYVSVVLIGYLYILSR